MPKEPDNRRVVVFIDGQFLFHCADEAFGYKTPNYDIALLAAAVSRQIKNSTLAQTRFYTGVPSPLKMPSWSGFWTAKLMAMRRQGVHVFSRQVQHDEETIKRDDRTTRTIKTWREKGIDIRIALDIVRLAYEKAYDVALLVSGDQDFTEVVDDLKLISQQQVRWIGIASAFPVNENDRRRGEIRGTTRIEIDHATYSACLDQNDYFPLSSDTATTPLALTDQDRFLAAVESNCGWSTRQYAEHILMRAKERLKELLNIHRGEVVGLFEHQQVKFPVLMVSEQGLVRIPLNNKANRIVFRGNKFKLDIIKKLAAIPNVALPQSATADPTIPISQLQHTDQIDLLFDALSYWTGLITKTHIPVKEKKSKPIQGQG